MMLDILQLYLIISNFLYCLFSILSNCKFLKYQLVQDIPYNITYLLY